MTTALLTGAGALPGTSRAASRSGPVYRPGVLAWFSSTFAALAVRDFRILWAGTWLAFTGFFMSTIVQSVVAFELTGANTAVGSVVFAQGIAMFALSPIGGALADRLPKRRMIALGQIVTGLVFLCLGGLVATVDRDAERTRLEKLLRDQERVVANLQTRLANKDYLQKAPGHLVDQTRGQLSEAEAALAGARRALEAVGET